MRLLALLVLTGCELFANVPNGALAAGGDDGSGDGGMHGGCTTSETCSSPTPVCDTANGSCVECVQSSDCMSANAAICDANVCRGCKMDAECTASTACMSDGTCADPATVVYASPTGTGATCSMATPCDLDTAIAQTTATANIIKLAAGQYERSAMVTIDKSMTFTGEGAIMHGTGGTPIVMFYDMGGFALTVRNVDFDLNTDFALECIGATGALKLDHVKLTNGEAAAYVSACAFDMDRTTIDSNTFYGLYLVGTTVSIKNSFITNNGASSQGGILFSTGTTGTIEHVTMSGNAATTMGAHAMRCTTPVDPGLVIRSSIIYGNGTPSIDPNCTVTHSIVDPDYTGGSSNKPMDPLYLAPATHDYHIMPGSPAIGLADPASMQPHDVDGDPRPQPTGSVADSGADEIP